MNELTVAEAAMYVGVSEQYIRRMLAWGMIDGRHVGKKMWLVDGDSLDLFKKERKASMEGQPWDRFAAIRKLHPQKVYKKKVA